MCHSRYACIVEHERTCKCCSSVPDYKQIGKEYTDTCMGRHDLVLQNQETLVSGVVEHPSEVLCASSGKANDHTSQSDLAYQAFFHSHLHLMLRIII